MTRPESRGNAVGKSILVIDDSETVLDLVGEGLRSQGFEVTCTSDIVAANRHIYRHRVDLILLDVQMPMLSGGEICRILKSKEETRGIPVVFHSDLPEAELERLAAEAGADGWVRKSPSLTRLAAVLERKLR